MLKKRKKKQKEKRNLEKRNITTEPKQVQAQKVTSKWTAAETVGTLDKSEETIGAECSRNLTSFAKIFDIEEKINVKLFLNHTLQELFVLI